MAQADTNTASRWLQQAPPVPAFAVPATREAWTKQRAEIRARLEELLGRFPPRPTVPAVETLGREDRGEYVLEKFRFDNGIGAVVPGWLLLPKAVSGRAPAILYCHWHGGEYHKGKIELFETNHTPEPPGPAFVKRGYVVLAIDACCFGERNGQGPGGSSETGGAGETTASKFNLWVGRTLWGSILRDDRMALDYLLSRPEVDPRRVGVTGMSMGATRSWWLMALEERLQAGVAVACLTRCQNLIQHEGLRHHGIYYFVPNLLNYFDTEAVVSLVAPRPLLCMNGDQDSGSPVDGIHAIEQQVRPAYALYGKGSNFASQVYVGVGHQYLPEMWRQTLQWFDEHLAAR
jgi:dienelactone hydrolase